MCVATRPPATGTGFRATQSREGQARKAQEVAVARVKAEAEAAEAAANRGREERWWKIFWSRFRWTFLPVGALAVVFTGFGGSNYSSLGPASIIIGLIVAVASLYGLLTKT